MGSLIRKNRTGKLLFIILLPTFLSVVACGGGGGGDGATVTPAPAAAVAAVNLTTVKGFMYGTAAAGSQMSFNIAGADATGQAWTSSFARVSDGPTTFEGNDVNKVRVLSTLTRTVDGASLSNIITYYFLISNNDFYKAVNTLGVSVGPTEQTPLPDNAHVGDNGNLMTVTGSNNITESTTWKLEADLNGNSKITFSFMTRDSTTNVITSMEDDTLYLDSAGNPYKLTMALITNSIQLTMSGNRSQ